MKTAFFEIEDWEINSIKDRLASESVNPSFFGAALKGGMNLPENDFEAISVFVDSSITKEVMDLFPGLKLITTRSTGFDHIDIKTAKEKGIKIGYVPGYGDNTVAEFAFGLILTLARRLYHGIDRIRETGKFSFDGLRGFDLKGKTIGVIGTGRIGCEVVKIAQGFGMNVVAYDVFPNDGLAKERNFFYLPLEELLRVSDVVTLHVPYGESTHYLINAQNINKMKKDAILINTSRGAVVETDALVKALASEALGGAGLDVLEEEGVIKDEESFLLHGNHEGYNLKTILENHVLIDMPNVVVTPHMAFNTNEAILRILNTDVENIVSFMRTGELKNEVSSS